MWGLTVICAAGAIALGMWSCSQTDGHKAFVKQQEAEKAAELQPHVIREFDGCKVYRWKTYEGDHWHYVTKCPLEVTTESNRTVRHGKTSRTKSESITTERN